MNSYSLEEAPANEAAAELQEGFVNISTTLKADSEATELMQPSDGALNDPASYAQAAAVFGVAAGELSANALGGQGLPMRVGVIGAIGLHELGFALGVPDLAPDRWNPFDQRHQLRNIVGIGRGKNSRQRNALRIREKVVLAARTTEIGWVRSSFFPAPTARIVELSAMAREKSRRSAPRNFASNIRCSRSQTPRRCQCRSRRQHVIPEPQPISWGNISHGMPDCNTNRMPLNARRLHSGLRPVYRLRRRFFGNSGSISAHKASSTIGLGIFPPDGVTMPDRTKPFNQVQPSFC
jgi:hypothetical protein